MSAPARSSGGVELIRDDRALALLEDASFLESWCRLLDACPWSTSCQSPAFAKAWFSAYGDLYEPLLIVCRSGARLAGLFFLAHENSTGKIVAVGAHHAEYQVWLAEPDRSDVFIAAALLILSDRFPKTRLDMHYLPPGTPTGWCSGDTAWAGRVILRRRPCPRMAVGAGSRVDESLRKKSNKSRINRLKKIAPLRLVQMRTREDLTTVINSIADYCDLRQGAINACLPFRDDPRKREFYLRMLDEPGLLHACVLMSGDEVVAANLGLASGSFVSIGVLAHSPFLAEHSPGKILILLLARELGEQGFAHLDLTPGGDLYKERSADEFEEVYTLSIQFDPLVHAFERAKCALRTGAATIGGRQGRRVMIAIQHLREQGVVALAGGLYRRLGGAADSRQTRFDGHSDLQGLNANRVGDLLDYRPSRWTDPSRAAFLRDACRRLEAGEQSYTLSKNGVLLHCEWRKRVPDPVSTDGLASTSSPRHSARRHEIAEEMGESAAP